MLGLFIAHIIINHRLRISPGGWDRQRSVRRGKSLRGYQHSVHRKRFLISDSPAVAIHRHTCDTFTLSEPNWQFFFAIFITFMAEIIALARNFTMWTRIVSPIRLFALLGVLTAARLPHNC